jgi:redox-sensitive bicupin YhaK (pirin superfamily)
MEIITYIRTGAITHRDNLGNEGRTTAGNVQVMSAGKGIVHSEYNLEKEDTTLFQIWIETAIMDIEPRWETKPFPSNNNSSFTLLASGRKSHSGSSALKIFQDAALFAGSFNAGNVINHDFDVSRHAYLVPSTGKIKINGNIISERDGVYINKAEKISVECITDSDIVFVDLPLIDQK